MKTISFSKVLLSIFLALLTIKPVSSSAQPQYRLQSVNVILSGTSTLHDWTMKASEANSDARFAIATSDKITDLEHLTFTIPVKSLKSQSKVMDNNTYKALKASENPNISFALTSADVASDHGSVYTIKARGKLTIAGTTRETDVVATGKYNPVDKSFTVTGSKKFKMTDYKVTPPTVMMGSIKTGDEITVAYNLKFVN